MDLRDTDALFAGALPALYDDTVVPMIFAPYAEDLATRVAARAPQRVLETAAGTGALTRRLAERLPAGAEIVATDLNGPMLARAEAVGTARPVQWHVANALHLPFGDSAFDAVACQFGLMFFPEKARAHAEVRRLLRPGGHWCFNVWDAIEHNEPADAVTQALAALCPADPPRFLARTPHGYHDAATIARDLALGGFRATPSIETVALRGRAPGPREAAAALCLGTPLRAEIEARGIALPDAVAAGAAALNARFGAGPLDAGLRAIVVTVARG